MTKRALIVEDTKLLRALLTDALVEHKVAEQVFDYEDAESFIQDYGQMIDATVPANLLVVDIELPGEDGLSLGRRVREREKAAGVTPAPIVFFSSRPHDDAIDEAVADCFPARYVQKQDEGSPDDVASAGVALMEQVVGLRDG